MLKADPNCAIAYWGIALSYLYNPHAPPPKENLALGLEAVKEAARFPQGHCWLNGGVAVRRPAARRRAAVRRPRPAGGDTGDELQLARPGQ